MPQDDLGREIAIEPGAPFEQRAKTARDELRRVADAVEALEQQVRKYAAYNDPATVRLLAGIREQLLALHAQWERKALAASNKAPLQPMREVAPAGRNGSGGFVFELRTDNGPQ